MVMEQLLLTICKKKSKYFVYFEIIVYLHSYYLENEQIRKIYA
jgi:hypothetical protein